MRSFLRRSYQVVAWLAVVAIITQFLLAALHVLNGLLVLWVALHIAGQSTATQPTPGRVTQG